MDWLGLSILLLVLIVIAVRTALPRRRAKTVFKLFDWLKDDPPRE